MIKKLSFKEFKEQNNLSKILLNRESKIDETIMPNGDIYCTIDDMINVCKKAKEKYADKSDLRIEQIWTNYEDCYLCFTYKELESDEEFNNRLHAMYDKYLNIYGNEVRIEKEKSYKNELEALNKKYGMS